MSDYVFAFVFLSGIALMMTMSIVYLVAKRMGARLPGAWQIGITLGALSAVFWFLLVVRVMTKGGAPDGRDISLAAAAAGGAALGSVMGALAAGRENGGRL